MPEQWDDDGQGTVGDHRPPDRAPDTDADVDTDTDMRDVEADEREAEADRRELRIDARELVLDRWEQEIAARAAAMGLLDEIEEHRREQRRRDRAADGHARRSAAENRRAAAIERAIRQGEGRRRPADPAATAAPGPHLPASLGELGAALAGDAPLTTVLGLVPGALVDSVVGCAAATVALGPPGRIEVADTTAPWAAALDERQAALGVGPLVSALADGPVLTADLGADGRWPELAGEAEARGRAVMAFGLRVAGQEAGVLSAYAERGGRFDPDAVAVGRFLAAITAVALTRSFERVTYEAQAQALQSALASRDAIGQAKGILMEQGPMSADEAFDLLRATSQRLNLKVKDIAVHLVEHRRMPGA